MKRIMLAARQSRSMSTWRQTSSSRSSSEHDPVRYPVLGFAVKDRYEVPLLAINNRHYTENLVEEPVLCGSVSMRIPASPFMPGEYSVDVFFGDGNSELEVIRDAFVLSVEARKFTESALMPSPSHNKICLKDVQWAYHQVAPDLVVATSRATFPLGRSAYYYECSQGRLELNDEDCTIGVVGGARRRVAQVDRRRSKTILDSAAQGWLRAFSRRRRSDGWICRSALARPARYPQVAS